MSKYIIIVFITSIIICCKQSNSYNISTFASNYIDEAITLMQNNSINKNKIDWEDFRADVYKQANGAKTIEDTYSSISYAIKKIGDNHSYFAPILAIPDSSELKPLPILMDEIVPENIGYIRVGFCMGDEEEIKVYINSITQKIVKQDKPNLKGWIVDLRGNFGGNMWPMLAAIGPILGEGILGYTFYPDGSFYSWNYNNGRVYDESGIWGESTKNYQLKTSNPYVAILTDTLTASSGEAVAIAFKGRNKTKSFGAQTYGVSTCNRIHILSDGSKINLTESVFADRHKTKYGSSVYPDIKCDEKETLSQAINWISIQN